MKMIVAIIRPEHLAISSTPTVAAASLSTLEELECEHVRRVLSATGGHKAKSAEVLGISRPRLNRLIAKYGLE